MLELSSTPQVTFRLNGENRTFVSNALQQIQTENAKTFVDFREFILFLIDEYSEKTAVNSVFATERDELLQKLNTVTLENESLQDQLSLEKSKEPQIIEKEIEKIVERNLTNEELLLKFNETQMFVIAKIHEYRNKNFNKQPGEMCDTVKELIFNKANLFNWGGEYATGLKMGDFKKDK